MNKYDIIKTTRTYQKLVDDYKLGKLAHCHLLLSKDKLSREIFGACFAILAICGDSDEKVAHKIIKKVHPDVFFLPKSEGLKVEDVELVLERLNYFPMEADCKVFVLQNFSSATVQAQNKLLKTLEETPPNVYFLLCSEKEDGILPTIKSRCQTLELEPLSDSALNILVSEYTVDARTQEIAKFYGRGEMGRIEEALTNTEICEMFDLAVDIVANLRSSSEILGYTIKVNKFRSNLLKFVQIYADVLQEILRVQILGKCDYKNLQFESLKEKISKNAILALQSKLILIIEMIDRFCNTTLIIDNVLIETCKCKLLP